MAKYSGKLGLYGFGADQSTKKLFRNAVSSGHVSDFLSSRPNLAGKINDRLQYGNKQPAANLRAATAAGGYSRNGIPPGSTDGMGTAPTPGSGTGGVTGPTGGSVATPEQMLEKYGGGGTDYIRNAQRFIDAQSNRYAQSPDMPSFDEMFNKFLTVANTEADRQASGLREAFGSRGGRYSGDLLNAETNLRKGYADITGTKANDILMNLEGARQQGLSNINTANANLAGLDSSNRQAAWQRMFLDAMRTTGVPPLFGSAFGAGAGFGAPDTIAFTG